MIFTQPGPDRPGFLLPAFVKPPPAPGKIEVARNYFHDLPSGCLNPSHLIAMKTLAFLLLLAAPVLAHATDIHSGDSLADVQAALGAPNGQVQLGDKLVLFYDRGQVQLVDGKVTGSKLISAEEFAAQKAKLAAQKAKHAAEGQALKAQKLADPDFVSASPGAQLIFWQDFRMHYPEVSCDDEYKLALAHWQADQQKVFEQQQIAAAAERQRSVPAAQNTQNTVTAQQQAIADQSAAQQAAADQAEAQRQQQIADQRYEQQQQQQLADQQAQQQAEAQRQFDEQAERIREDADRNNCPPQTSTPAAPVALPPAPGYFFPHS
jgi:hypothetical protein